MRVLSSPDASAGIACALPMLEMADRLDSLQDLVGDRLRELTHEERRLRIAIGRDGIADLHAQTVAWAEAERACCPYLGFAVGETPAEIVLEIAAPHGAEPTLGGIVWLVQAAGEVTAMA